MLRQSYWQAIKILESLRLDQPALFIAGTRLKVSAFVLVGERRLILASDCILKHMVLMVLRMKNGKAFYPLPIPSIINQFILFRSIILGRVLKEKPKSLARNCSLYRKTIFCFLSKEEKTINGYTMIFTGSIM